MIVGVGLDILPVARMERELRSAGSAFRDRVFTPSEIAYCESKRYPARHFAARFAAKEAALKALGGPADVLPSWCDVEVCAGEGGAPRLILRGPFRELAMRLRADRLHVSITHTAEFAAAAVVAESAREGTAEEEVTE